ncbi:MAG: hypothetical protein OXI72_07575 [Gemmatimonadota bacterium]|nr:hypothetical protein [Gemmatimonadota bacterium]
MATKNDRKRRVKRKKEYLEDMPEEFVKTMHIMLNTAKALTERCAKASSTVAAEKWAAAAKDITIAASKMEPLWWLYLERGSKGGNTPKPSSAKRPKRPKR